MEVSLLLCFSLRYCSGIGSCHNTGPGTEEFCICPQGIYGRFCERSEEIALSKPSSTGFVLPTTSENFNSYAGHTITHAVAPSSTTADPSLNGYVSHAVTQAADTSSTTPDPSAMKPQLHKLIRITSPSPQTFAELSVSRHDVTTRKWDIFEYTGTASHFNLNGFVSHAITHAVIPSSTIADSSLNGYVSHAVTHAADTSSTTETVFADTKSGDTSSPTSASNDDASFSKSSTENDFDDWFVFGGVLVFIGWVGVVITVIVMKIKGRSRGQDDDNMVIDV